LANIRPYSVEPSSGELTSEYLPKRLRKFVQAHIRITNGKSTLKGHLLQKFLQD